MWDVLSWFGDKEVQAKKDYRHAREIATSDPECKWTESALAEKLGVIQQTVNTWILDIRSTNRLRWTGQSRAVFESQYLTGSFYLYHSFSVIVAQPLSLVVRS